MKSLIVLFLLAASAVAQNDALLTRAVTKLIDENRQLRAELSVLKHEAERLKALESEFETFTESHLNRPASGNPASEALQQRYDELLLIQKLQQQEIDKLQKRLAALEHAKRSVTLDTGEVTEAVVVASSLNVRVEPSLSGAIGFGLLKGMRVQVGERRGAWSRVYRNDRTGWASSRWLRDMERGSE